MDKERRKQIAAEYKQQKTAGGVYRIYNKVTGKCIVKADINIEAVKNRFSFSLKTDTCLMPKMQPDWMRHGASSFELEVLYETEMKNDEVLRAFKERLKQLEEEAKEKYKDQLY